MEKLKYNCIFGGGAVRGLCYVGVLKAFKELDIEIGSLAGSSVGAVFASLLAAGYSEDELKDMFLEFNFHAFRDINIGFTPDLSFSKGEVFLNWLREKISYKVLGNKTTTTPVCFKDLKKDLFILTTDLKENKPFVFSRQKTPDVEVAFAVRASAGMPGLMKPVNYKDSILIDGDLSKSWPVWKTDTSLICDDYRILEFRLEGSNDANIKNPIDYFLTVYNTLSYLATSNIIDKYQKKDKFDYIIFDTKDLVFIDFTLSKDEREKLITLGYRETMKYFRETLVEKKKTFVPLYTNLINKIEELKISVKLNNHTNAMNKINDVLSCAHYEFEIIDTDFIKKLFDLKKAIEDNRQSGLFGNKIKEKEKILNMLEITERKLKDHTLELNDYIKKYNH